LILKVEILKHGEINKSKWDRCITHSLNGLIYSESVYLDHMSPEWYGIVADDYTAVMPLCWRKKWGISYLFQPVFCQQGGIFSPNEITPDYFRSFQQALESFASYIEINLNYGNSMWYQGKATERNNFICDPTSLSIDEPYPYSEYINERLKRLQKFRMQYREASDPVIFIQDYKLLYNQKMRLRDADYHSFTNLALELKKRNRIAMREVWDEKGKAKLASALLFIDSHRFYTIINNLYPEGRNLLANYFLFDQLIREASTQKRIMDFEGSDLEGVAYFYKKFSTSNQPYYSLKYNNLPFPINIIKR